MITLRGVEGASKTLLSSMLREVPCERDLTVSWGISIPDALNGMPRLNGLQQFNSMENAGLQVPIWTTDVADAKDWVRNGLLVFGRQYFHTMGQDITGPGKDAPRKFRRAWLESDFWVQVVPNVVEEWRLHVFLGKIIARGLKHQAEPPSRLMPVRNRRNGWLIRHDVDPPKGLRAVAKTAALSLGYDFCAIDMLVTNLDPLSVVVLEGNKSPGLDNYTATAYKNAIHRWTNGEPTDGI